METLSREQFKQILRALQKHKKDNHETINEEGRLLDADTDGAMSQDVDNEKKSGEKIAHGPGKYLRQASVKSMMARLKPIRNRYTSSFTMHALDHIINGTLPEKVFWTIKLFIVIGTAIFMCRGFIASYFKGAVETTLEYQSNTTMELPLVFVCGKEMEHMLSTQCDCSSKSSKSYNETVCTLLQQKCPRFCKDDESDENCSENLMKQGVTCDERVLGQCVLLNGNGNLMQTLTSPGMMFKHKISDLNFPYKVSPAMRDCLVSVSY